MIIFLSFLQGNPNHPIPAYSFWEYYVKKGIEESDNSWLDDEKIDWAEGLIYATESIQLAQWKSDVWSKTIEFLKKNHVDLFLSYLYPKQIDINAIKEIQNMGIPCVNFFCDNVRDFLIIPEEFSVFNLNWVPEFKAKQMYKKANYPFVNVPMPMYVDPVNRNSKFIETNEISFIGSHDIQRRLFFESITSKNVDLPLRIYGKGWSQEEQKYKSTVQKTFLNQIEFIKKYGLTALYRKIRQKNISYNEKIYLDKFINTNIDFAEYISITKNSKVVIGVNRYPSFNYPLDAPNTYSRLRDIEAPMLGACYLTEWTEGIEELYDLDNEILTYRSEEEFLYQVERLNKDKTLRQILRHNGQLKAINKHSVKDSLNKIIYHL